MSPKKGKKKKKMTYGLYLWILTTLAFRSHRDKEFKSDQSKRKIPHLFQDRFMPNPISLIPIGRL